VKIVRLWEEAWERKKLTPQGDPIQESRLAAKYQGLKFYDIDWDNNKVMIIHRMGFRKERGKNKCDVFAIVLGFNVKFPNDSPNNGAFL
jgi:hypothetical protein